MNEKIYVGNGTEKHTQYGSLISISLDVEELLKAYNEHGFQLKNGKKMIKATVMKKREPGQYGDTHYITLDTWHPDNYQKPAPIQIANGGLYDTPEIGENEDIPF